VQDYWRGECPGRELWWRGVKEVNKPPAGQKSQKTGGFCSLFSLKIAEYVVFSQKYLIRYIRYNKYFLRNTLIQGVCPQPSGEGLTLLSSLPFLLWMLLLYM
jgi:hypothetical protein